MLVCERFSRAAASSSSCLKRRETRKLTEIDFPCSGMVECVVLLFTVQPESLQRIGISRQPRQLSGDNPLAKGGGALEWGSYSEGTGGCSAILASPSSCDLGVSGLTEGIQAPRTFNLHLLVGLQLRGHLRVTQDAVASPFSSTAHSGPLSSSGP